MQLFGDSSFIVHYLRRIGYKLGRSCRPARTSVGRQARQPVPQHGRHRHGGRRRPVVHQHRLLGEPRSASRRVAIGANNFLGNRIAYPAQGRTGDNCLLATKVMVPMDGKVREGVGLLGSPSFEIPRTVDRDHQLDVTDPAQVRRLLRRKNRHNARDDPDVPAVAVDPHVFAITMLTLIAVDLHSELGLAVALAGIAVMPLTVGYLILVDRLVRRMMVRRPERLLDLRPRVLAARAVLEARGRPLPPAVQRHPAQERRLAAARRADRQAGVRRRLHVHRDAVSSASATAARSTRARRPVPLPGGRRVQVRPQHHRRRDHARRRRVRPLRRADRRRRAARAPTRS